MTSTTDPSGVVAAYFAAWQANDFATVRPLLADDLAFRGPVATMDNAEDYIASQARLSKRITKTEVRHVFVSDADVLVWYDMHTNEAPPVPVANWCHVDNGRITRIRLAADPRGLLGLPHPGA